MTTASTSGSVEHRPADVVVRRTPSGAAASRASSMSATATSAARGSRGSPEDERGRRCRRGRPAPIRRAASLHGCDPNMRYCRLLDLFKLAPASAAPVPRRGSAPPVPRLVAPGRHPATAGAPRPASWSTDWFPGVPVVLVALVLGPLVANTVGAPARCPPGARVAAGTLLRAGIVLLGFELVLQDMFTLGVRGWESWSVSSSSRLEERCGRASGSASPTGCADDRHWLLDLRCLGDRRRPRRQPARTRRKSRTGSRS